MPRLDRLATLVLTAMLAGCGDDGTGPENGDVEFPALDAAVTAEFCVRGTAEPTMFVSGELTMADCPTVFPVGFAPDLFYETWRVKVASNRTVTFEVTSGFDSYLDLFRVTNLSAPGLSLDNLVDFDDDSGDGSDALISANLLANVEYWVMVSGYEPTDEGPYTLEIRTN